MFSINLCQYAGEKNAVTKTVTNVLSVYGDLREETSITDPVIVFSGELAGLININYVHIPAWGRYYFVTGIRSVAGNLIEISMHVDVLMSWATQIKQQIAIIKRQENKWNLYLNDGVFAVYQNPDVLTKNFPSGFAAHEFVLAVAGS